MSLEPGRRSERLRAKAASADVGAARKRASVTPNRPAESRKSRRVVKEKASGGAGRDAAARPAPARRAKVESEELKAEAAEAACLRKETGLLDLVDDALVEVFQRLDLGSIHAMERTCRQLRRIALKRVVYRGIDHVQLIMPWRKEVKVTIHRPGLSLASVTPLQPRLQPKPEWKGRKSTLKRQRPANRHPEWESKVLVHLRRRGARLRILEAEGCRGITVNKLQLRTMTVIHCHEIFPNRSTLLRMWTVMKRLECLVFQLDVRTQWCQYGFEDQLGKLRPESLPALRVLIVVDHRPLDHYKYRYTSPYLALKAAFDRTDLFCLKTPYPEAAFLRGPQDTPPHPDLLRLSRRYDWAF